MNIEEFLSPHFILSLGLALFFSLTVVLVIYAFLAYRRLEYMEHLLNKCSFIAFHSRFWDNSPRGRMMRLNAVAVVVLLPKRFLKRGLIDWQQVQEFPRVFKRLFQGMFFVGLFFFVCGAFIWLRQ
ncbi:MULTISPECIES: hypothetical protein [unclassified Pseudomonas]|uniref:hypothetical protein n=1 Tax=unclassified Pseudomonas TaxID=196821 RepID=UPI00131FC07D|nr:MULTISPECIES: hypothetical protein [unclassified Pseudomonas]NWA86415.1 hypothetical protein [Pseudomonas sp. D2002]QHD07220.1 hypothetical protein PspR76_16420 [Pseudomonas sp. R76]